MKAQQTPLIKKLFFAAVEVPADRVEPFLAEQCGGDSYIKGEVLSLLAALRDAGPFLDRDGPAITNSPTHPAPTQDEAITGIQDLERFRWLLLDEKYGEAIDRYKLIDLIGEGGHGVVFRAEQQEPIRRIVALKVIRRGMESDQMRARFDLERQTLASMEHPNIAKLLDAGQTDLGRPYFVMELVQGIPISTYCDTHQLSIRSRVELFITFCRAIHYAHEKGIIHQDLKPANVLVSQVGGVPTPKVIDFGIVRVRSVGSLDFDRGPLIGTPRYLSPELLESITAAADIRTDIFSLGSMLFELLTGMSAIDWDGQPIRTVQDIRETFTNARWLSPSERLQQAAESCTKQADLQTISQNRGIGLATLIRSMHEDLDWIVSKATQFDRSGRYDSVAALADDLQRYLDYRPVLAAQPAVWYQIRRFCARNKTVVASLLTVLILLLSSLVIVSAALVRVRAAESLRSKSEAEAIAHMGDSLLQQARSAQYSHLQGQRLQSLRVLEQAARIKRSINPSDLRNQAIASMSLIDAVLIDVRKGLPNQINSAMAANADLYAVSDRTGLIQILHRTGDRPVWVIPGNGFPIDNFVLFSRDGKYMAARYASGPCGLRLWDLTTRLVLYENSSRVAFDFAGSGNQFAVGTSTGNLEIRDLPTSTLRKTISAHGRVQKIAFRPGDDRLSVWSAHDGLRIVDLGATEKVWPVPTDLGEYTAWHPNGTDLAVTGRDMLSRIEIIDSETGKLHAILQGHVSQPIDLHFTADGGFLVSGGWDGRLLIWDSVRGRELLGLDGFGGSLQISADSDRFSFGSGHDSQMWRLIASEQCRSFTTSIEDSSVWSADITADGRYLAAATGVGVRVWENATGRQFCFLAVPAARSVLFSQDSTQLFVSTAAGVQSWKLADLADRKDPVLPPVDANATCAMAVTADGKMIVSGASDGSLFWGELAEPAAKKILGRHRAPPRYVSISPDGAFAASSSRRENLFKVWDLRSHKLAIDLPLGIELDETGEVAFSADSKTLCVSDHRQYRWYRVADWKLIRSLPRQMAKNPGHIAYSPDGRLLALAGPACSVDLVEATTGEELATLQTPAAPFIIESTRFSPDSNKLIVTGSLASVIVWDLPSVRAKLASMNLDWR